MAQNSLTSNLLALPHLEKKSAMTFYKAVFIYLLGGLVGTVWETIFNLCFGYGLVYCSGSIFTPFNPVYGLGALFIIFALREREKLWEVFLIGAFMGGAVEYTLSFLEEKILGSRSWDYSNMPLNLHGRTTIIFMAFWGLLCTLVVLFAYRPLDRLLDKIPKRVMKVIALIFLVIVAADMIITVAALIRYSLRADLVAPDALGKLLDGFFNDDFMKRHFPQMRF